MFCTLLTLCTKLFKKQKKLGKYISLMHLYYLCIHISSIGKNDVLINFLFAFLKQIKINMHFLLVIKEIVLQILYGYFE